MSERFEIDPEEREDHSRAAPRRRALRAGLVALIIVGVAVFAWWGYEVATRPEIPAKVPEIHPEAGPVKEAPANPGGMQVPDQNSLLLNHEGKSNAKAEQLLPPPEKVLPRPVAPAPAVTAPPPPAAVPPPELPAVPPAAPPPKVASPAAPATPPAHKAAAPPPKAVVPQNGKAWRVQLGAVRSEAAARKSWERLKAAQPDLLGKLGVITPKVDLGAKGTFYRIQAGPLADGAQAARYCSILKSRHVACIVIKP